MPGHSRGWFLACSVAALLGVDQLSKFWVQTNLSAASPIAVVPDLFWLSYYTNSGAVAGIGRQSPQTIPLLISGSIGLVAVLIALYRYYVSVLRPSWRVVLFMALSIAPLLSHALDRVRQGYVIDFLHFAGLPVFNFADVLPYLAIILLGIESMSLLRAKRRHGLAERASS